MERADILAVIIENMQDIIEGADDQDIDETKSMLDYGADSLEMVEVVSRSMKQLKVKVQRTELGQAKNIGDLVTLFEQAAASSHESDHAS